MATQAYVTELQAAPQPSQPPQAPPQAQPQPPPPPSAAPQPPQPPASAATPQPQYVTELQSPQTQAQPLGSQKQYVTELPAAPTPSQPASTPAPSSVSQQYIVVTVSGKWTCVQGQGTLLTTSRGAFGSILTVRVVTYSAYHQACRCQTLQDSQVRLGGHLLELFLSIPK